MAYASEEVVHCTENAEGSLSSVEIAVAADIAVAAAADRTGRTAAAVVAGDAADSLPDSLT